MRLPLDRGNLVRDGWRVTDDGFWTLVLPPGAELPGQGWKLHVSTVPACAAQVLGVCAGVLHNERVGFKFASDTDAVTTLVSHRYDVTGLGKFLTAYPADPAELVRVADRLSQALRGMPGPAVPSDARWAPDAPVYYRYGVFTGQDWLTEDGAVCSALYGPSGEVEVDRRDRFAPPAWAPVLPRPAATGSGTGRPGAGTTDGAGPQRLRITEVLLRSARGGVFAAVDGGRDVVIKHVRAHVGADLAGRDARDRLRHEADVLTDLAGTGLVPRVVELIEAQHASMLVMSRMAGTPLRAWTLGRWQPPAGLDPAARAAAAGLADAVEKVHQAGYVLRDLTPSNVVMTPAGTVRLVDLELAARPGDMVEREYTAGYAAPEQVSAAPVAPAPHFAADSYALGAVLYFLATGGDPDTPPGDNAPDVMLPARLAAAGAPPALRRLVAVLLAGDPDRRPSAAVVAAVLRRPPPSVPPPQAASALAMREVLTDGLSTLLSSLDTQPDAAGWRRPRDPLCLGYGRSGPLLMAARCGRLVDELGLRAQVAALAGHIRARLPATPRVLPGLASGRPGILWALWEAAGLLDDLELGAQCLALARCLPTALDAGQPLRSGLAHGAAGQGMFLLRLWHATADLEWRDRVLSLVDDLVPPDRPGGRSADTADLASAGLASLGLANGLAGRALFLLHAGVALRHDAAVDAARATVDAVAQSTAVTHRDTRDLSHDSGLAGLGRLLAAAADLVDHQRARTSAWSIMERLRGWTVHARPGLAHGACGWVELALDLGATDRASELLAELLTRANRREGRWVLPDDSGSGSHYALADGVGGWMWVLGRAVCGGPGIWDPRDPVPAGHRAS